MFKKALLAIALFMLPVTGAFAQTTASQTIMGYTTTSGCPSGQTVCFVQYGATVPTSGGGGGGSTVVTNAGTFAVQNTAATPAGTNVIGKVSIDQTTLGTTNAVQTIPGASGGLSVKSIIVANNTTSVAVDASPGQIYGITAYSISSATPVYLKFYNASQGSTTCGSGTPVQRELVPATGTTGSGVVIPIASGIAYSTAITVCVTAGIADNDTTAPAASSYLVNVWYK